MKKDNNQEVIPVLRGWYTTSVAARKLGLSRNAMHKKIMAGEVPGVHRLDTDNPRKQIYLIPHDALAKIQERRQRREANYAEQRRIEHAERDERNARWLQGYMDDLCSCELDPGVVPEIQVSEDGSTIFCPICGSTRQLRPHMTAWLQEIRAFLGEPEKAG